jgi:hypothetical protein
MWEKIKAWFKDSETIFWARLQVFIGSIWSSFLGFDWALMIRDTPPTWREWAIAGVIVAQGGITEYARRRRAEDLA